MPMESADFEEVLQEALTERDTDLKEKELPEINIGEALPIKDGLDFALEYADYGVSKVVGSVKDGIIGNKTNSLKTIDSEIEWLKAPVGPVGLKLQPGLSRSWRKLLASISACRPKSRMIFTPMPWLPSSMRAMSVTWGVKGQEGLLTGASGSDRCRCFR
ncbi:Uncharacterised protein [Kluyvera cryocrescens]|uniref:Uncharacterized protein n=1 Tax=Kluyvera cryocrescens TaxID=580 RepID=A0A485BNB8_KLUCR|nr:Uncharacterised protein [Kluyvera cryocrescens]